MTAPNPSRLDLRLPAPMLDRVREAAAEEGQTIASWVRAAILAALRRRDAS